MTERSVSWPEALTAFRTNQPLPETWTGIFGPLQSGKIDDLVVIGQLGQSLDGRVATASGHSHYINGDAGLDHLHRLRSLVDAVVIGVGTAIADDPQLTVRRVAGPDPVRVVIDPNGRLPKTARCFARGGRCLVFRSTPLRSDDQAADVIGLPAIGGRLACSEILLALAERGLRRVLIEGGAQTVSRFLAAGCLDRLHIVVAPMILGDGPSGIQLPSIDKIDDALRPRVTAHRLGDEMLFDCDLSDQRAPLGRAKKST